MATLTDIGVSAGINLMGVLVFLLAFGLLRLQPFAQRIYFPKSYAPRDASSRSSSRPCEALQRCINLNARAYLRFFEWAVAAVRKPEAEVIEIAGLDSAVYLRIYLLGLKIFVPLLVMAFVVLVPVNWTGGNLKNMAIEFSGIDKLSISNISEGSDRFWTHMILAYTFTAWTCYLLLREYRKVATMRLQFLATERRRPDEYTVLVRNIPPEPEKSVSEVVENFFLSIHRENYLLHKVVYDANKLEKVVKEKKENKNWLLHYREKLNENPSERPTHKKGFVGLWGEEVDSIDFYSMAVNKVKKKATQECERITLDPNAKVSAAFVSFRNRWAAATCAQTQQTQNPMIWLTEWAPEPRDVYWPNLSKGHHSARRIAMGITFFALTFCFMGPVLFVQSLANIEGIQKVAPFLKPIISIRFVKSLIQGFLPGIALKVFLIFLPTILMQMAKFEGFISRSSLEMTTASRYYLFLLVNVFLGSIITGSALQQLRAFLKQSPTKIPIIVGNAIPLKATFFITFIMVDGWAGVAGEILRMKPLIIYHLKNYLVVKTKQDREKAMNPGSIKFYKTEPRLQLYFLLGLVYAVVTPILLPFIVIFFGFAYVVYRHQIINVYSQKFESAAAFWPYVHRRVIIALVISQLTLMGLMSTKKAIQSTPLLLGLPFFTIIFHKYCTRHYRSAFVTHSLQEAVLKDNAEQEREPNFDLEGYLSNAYVNPVFNYESDEDDKESSGTGTDQDLEDAVTATKRTSRRKASRLAKFFGSSSPSHDIV